MIASCLAFLASATLFISVITLIRRRILRRPKNLTSESPNRKAKEMSTTMESNTLINSLRNVIKNPKSLRAISMTKNEIRK